MFAAISAALFLSAAFSNYLPLVVALWIAPLCVAARGMCNVLDGLVAVEGGLKTPAGELFNDFPDRIADLLFYVPAGYAVIGFPGGVELGWAAGAMAVLTAYVRLLGGAMGAPQRFLGPMAKTHRMAVFSLGCIASAIELAWSGTTRILALTLALIIVGCAATAWRRAAWIIRDRESTA